MASGGGGVVFGGVMMGQEPLPPLLQINYVG